MWLFFAATNAESSLKKAIQRINRGSIFTVRLAGEKRFLMLKTETEKEGDNWPCSQPMPWVLQLPASFESVGLDLDCTVDLRTVARRRMRASAFSRVDGIVNST